MCCQGNGCLQHHGAWRPVRQSPGCHTMAAVGQSGLEKMVILAVKLFNKLCRTMVGAQPRATGVIRQGAGRERACRESCKVYYILKRAIQGNGGSMGRHPQAGGE